MRRRRGFQEGVGVRLGRGADQGSLDAGREEIGGAWTCLDREVEAWSAARGGATSEEEPVGFRMRAGLEWSGLV